MEEKYDWEIYGKQIILVGVLWLMAQMALAVGYLWVRCCLTFPNDYRDIVSLEKEERTKTSKTEDQSETETIYGLKTVRTNPYLTTESEMAVGKYFGPSDSSPVESAAFSGMPKVSLTRQQAGGKGYGATVTFSKLIPGQLCPMVFSGLNVPVSQQLSASNCSTHTQNRSLTNSPIQCSEPLSKMMPFFKASVMSHKSPATNRNMSVNRKSPLSQVKAQPISQPKFQGKSRRKEYDLARKMSSRKKSN